MALKQVEQEIGEEFSEEWKSTVEERGRWDSHITQGGWPLQQMGFSEESREDRSGFAWNCAVLQGWLPWLPQQKSSR